MYSCWDDTLSPCIAHITHILEDLNKNDMSNMESLEEIDKLCQDINFDEDICDGSQNKENK